MVVLAPLKLAKGPKGGRPNWTFLHNHQMKVYKTDARYRTVVAGRRWGKCLADDTMISMADGSEKPVQLIKTGDIVLTLNETTYAIEPRVVQHVHNNGIKETVVVKTSGRSLRCTPNHPLLVNNAWIEAGDIKKGDLVAVPRKLAFGDRRMPQHELDYLAIWLAEGCDYKISNTTPEILDVVRNCAQEFGEGLTVVSKNGIDWSVSNNDRTGGPQSGSNNPARRMLEDFGVWGLNSKTKIIPDEIFQLEQDQVARFLNLFFACDGSISRRSKNTWGIEVQLANETMVRQISKLLLKFGIRGQIRHKAHSACSVKTGKPFESWRFIASTPEAIIAFADEIGCLSKEEAVENAKIDAALSRGNCNVYLPISHDEFAEHLVYEPKEVTKYGGYNCKFARNLPDELRSGLNSWRKQTPSRVSTRRYQALKHFSDGFFESIAEGDVVWEEVIEVASSDRIQTWDLTIEGNHNFFAEGIVTHNTQLSKTEMIREARKPRRLVWYIAPTYQMARQIMWEDLKDTVPRKWIKKINETQMSITLKNNSVIALKGADKPDTLRGVGLDFVVLDEFQDMRPETWNTVIQPTLASTRGRALFIGCVTGKTKVLAKEGFSSIESFSKGSPDKTLDPMRKDFYGLNGAFHEADGFWNNGRVPTRKIKTRWGFELEASHPHPVWVMGDDGRPFWKKTCDITPGDRIAIARGMEVWGNQDPTKGFAERVQAWRQQFVGRQGPNPKPLPDTTMSEDLAYFLGLWIAEGSIEEKVGRVTITCGDASVGDFLKSGRVLGLNFKPVTGRDDQWRVNSYELVEFMRHLGMPLCKAPEKLLPEWVTRGRREWACALVAGMWDGDGHVISNGEIRAGYNSASHQLVSDLQLLMTNIGVIGKVTTHDQPATARAKESVQHRYIVQGQNVARLRDSISLRIERKQAALDSMNVQNWSHRDGVPNQGELLRAVRNSLRRQFQDKKCSKNAFSAAVNLGQDISYRGMEMFVTTHEDSKAPELEVLRKNLSDHYYWDHVESIEDGAAETFDFTIPDTHSFWSNGFISHNTPKSFNHLYEHYMRGQNDDELSWRSWQFQTITSPFILPEEIDEARRNMSDKEFRQEFEACHLPDTKIRTMNGQVKSISDIKQGDMIPFLDDHGQVQSCEVLRIGTTGIKPICEATLETGEIVAATNHHKFKVHDNA